MNKGLKYGLITIVVAGIAGLLFVAAVAIGVGQHHPPKTEERPFVEGALSLDGIADGSWWTDGHCYYEIHRTDGGLSMSGYTLHEGGMDCALQCVNDTLAVVSGGATFARIGCPVTFQQMVIDDNRVTDLLIATDSTSDTPVAVLQRFDGEEWEYEQRAVYRLLEGVYTDDKDSTVQWTFYADGTMTMSPNDTPRPYAIETLYHMPTDVITLPDGRHVGIARDEKHLFLFDTSWDNVEEVWMAEEEVMQRFSCDQEPVWLAGQLFCEPISNLMFNEWMEMLSDSLRHSPEPFIRLNAALIGTFL